jgi:hypothetical protein
MYNIIHRDHLPKLSLFVVTRPKRVKELMRKVAHLPVLIAMRSRLQVGRFGAMGTEMCSPQGPEGIGAFVDPCG